MFVKRKTSVPITVQLFNIHFYCAQLTFVFSNLDYDSPKLYMQVLNFNCKIRQVGGYVNEEYPLKRGTLYSAEP
jgi:hypothetical protein